MYICVYICIYSHVYIYTYICINIGSQKSAVWSLYIVALVARWFSRISWGAACAAVDGLCSKFGSKQLYTGHVDNTGVSLASLPMPISRSQIGSAIS